MKRAVLFVSLLVLVASTLVVIPVRASEGELEWEAVPRPNTVHVRYIETADPQTGLIDQLLLVQVFNAPPNRTVDLYIKNRRIGTILTDPYGEATLFVERFGVVPGADGRPPLRQRVDTGDVCLVSHGSRILSSKFISVVPQDN